MHIIVLNLFPKPEFLALNEEQRRNLILTVAARLQEWSGEQGGVIFAQRAVAVDGRQIVVLVVSSRTTEFSNALIANMSSGEISAHFTVNGAAGPLISVNPNVEGSSAVAMSMILQQFLDVGRSEG